MIANSENRDLDIGMNPAWRDTVSHLIVLQAKPHGLSPAQIQSEFGSKTTRALRRLDPDSGAYFNEVSRSRRFRGGKEEGGK